MAVLALFLTGCAAPSAPQGGLIVAFGDSYTEGFGASRDEAYPARLEQMLGRPVLNKGVTGETAGEALRRLDRDVVRNQPDLVIIEFGVNEAYRGQSVASSLRDLETMIVRTQQETDARIVLVGVHFRHFREDFDAGLRELAQRYGTGVVVDVLDGIVSSRAETDDGDPALRHDPFHPNARGYAIMAERILPAARTQLSQT